MEICLLLTFNLFFQTKQVKHDLETIFGTLFSRNLFAEDAMIEIDAHSKEEFTLKHLQGTISVKYSAAGWKQISHSMGRTNLASELLRKSEKYQK